MTLGWFLKNDALIFIVVVILSAFDFWTVKNVSGRIIVGLRWWTEIKDDGKEVSIYESDNESKLLIKIIKLEEEVLTLLSFGFLSILLLFSG